MIKDRDQKQKALKLAIANRWFCQLEVDVEPGRTISATAPLVTDLDVLACIPDQFKGFRSIVFDCKTKAKESPVNRALWLAGVLKRLKADQGFCILKKDFIELDHRLMANNLQVILLGENEFELYAKVTSPAYSNNVGHVGQMNTWDQFFGISERFPSLEIALKFIRGEYWMAQDAAEACRKTLATLRALHQEFDPARPEHQALFMDFCAIFARALALVTCQIFKAYLHPANQGPLSEALLIMLYGGHDAYQHRNEMFKLIRKYSAPEHAVSDLSLPEWDRFIQLTRQLLDAPSEAQKTPLILREVAFSMLVGSTDMTFAKTLCSETAQGARFSVLIASYLCKAARLPPEFGKLADNALLPLIPVT